jgi:hypothetical protein
MEQVTGFSQRDTGRIGRSVRATERLAPPSLGGQLHARRGGGITSNKGTVQGQCDIMLTDNQQGWGYPFMLPMSD